ncbi:uncharacterized protein N7473_000364 [Penicillium subrubescens]|nr:uncharacterized protein N7473_000364 [Penicillium subrubescens]KAJ5911061.1 hypothetical protein N7473_000364 [Penicillium subrubescens]
MEQESNLHNLPSSAGFIDRLINELARFQADLPRNTPAELDPPRTQSTHQPKPPQNALSRLSPSQLARVKPLLLTLHCLFPNDLLPALDILDRRLVQRLVVRGDKVNAVPSASASTQEGHPGNNKEIQHDESNTAINQTTLDDTKPEDTLKEDLFLFLVTSASSAPAYPIGAAPASSTTTSTSTYTTIQQPQKVYEVRLNAWNCTCPTFTLSTFRDLESRLHFVSKPDPIPSPRFKFSSPPPSNTAMLRDRDDGSAFTSAPTFASTSAPESASAVYPFGGTLTCPTDRDSPPACKHILACVLFARCPGLFGDGDDDEDRGVDVSMEELAGWCAGWGG